MTGSRRPAKSRTAKRNTPASGSATPAAGSAGATSRRGKFNARGRHVNGIWQASEAQAERYEQLLRLEMFGSIERLETEVPFDLVVNNRKITRYRCDFRYDVLDEHGLPVRTIIEDVKGFETPDFRIKLALFNALVVPELTLIKPGTVKGSRGAFIARHWDGAIPPGPGEFKTPPDTSLTNPIARKDDPCSTTT